MGCRFASQLTGSSPGLNGSSSSGSFSPQFDRGDEVLDVLIGGLLFGCVSGDENRMDHDQFGGSGPEVPAKDDESLSSKKTTK